MASEADNNPPHDVSGRGLVNRVDAGGAPAIAGAPLPPRAAVAQEHAPQGHPAAVPQLEALETLTAAEADTLEAIVARLIPSDENGPGATEARAAHYIDRA